MQCMISIYAPDSDMELGVDSHIVESDAVGVKTEGNNAEDRCAVVKTVYSKLILK